MDRYIDITVLPDPEFSTTTLMNALYSKLHRTLAVLGEVNIGVSFPHLKKTPGEILRLHGGELALQKLINQNWSKGLSDYIQVTQIQLVPKETKHIRVERVQEKMTAARLRRAVKRGSMTVDEAETVLANRQQLKKPFLQLQSSSTKQRFPLFINQGKPQSKMIAGKFNSYGLSDSATVPWF